MADRQLNQHVDVGAHAAGVDLFIGEISHMGRGIGTVASSNFLRTVVFADQSITECVMGH